MAESMKLQPDDGPRYNLGIGPSSNNLVGSHRKFARRFTEGIKKLVGNVKGDRSKEDHRTYRKISGGCWSMQECPSVPFCPHPVVAVVAAAGQAMVLRAASGRLVYGRPPLQQASLPQWADGCRCRSGGSSCECYARRRLCGPRPCKRCLRSQVSLLQAAWPWVAAPTGGLIVVGHHCKWFGHDWLPLLVAFTAKNDPT
ncbi:hypothetical protein BHM03_00030831 [Ensete ventricosum]|nr:hypothetical protein BHM03_00030831 [Ensete ventricosum]